MEARISGVRACGFWQSPRKMTLRFHRCSRKGMRGRRESFAVSEFFSWFCFCGLPKCEQRRRVWFFVCSNRGRMASIRAKLAGEPSGLRGTLRSIRARMRLCGERVACCKKGRSWRERERRDSMVFAC